MPRIHATVIPIDKIAPKEAAEHNKAPLYAWVSAADYIVVPEQQGR